MASRIREFDWSGVLGPPHGWPSTLKAMVRLALTTQHPIFIFWGPEHICLYNDAYKASLGPEKHPQILGSRGPEAWPEVWHLIGPQIDMVLRGDGATWHENQLVPIWRHGELQDVYWTYSHAPIADETAPSGVGGVLVICSETTVQVEAAQRLADDRARLARLFEQSPGFMAMLQGPQHRIELANPAFQRLVGDRDVIGRPVSEALPEVREQGFIDLLDRVYRTGTAYAASGTRYLVTRADGLSDERYVDFVYQPITNEVEGVIGIFIEGTDVTERFDAEASLRRSEADFREKEEQLRLAVEAAEVSLWDVDLVSETLYWPARVKAMFGIAPDTPVSMADFYAGLHPEDRESTSAAYGAALDPAVRAVYDVEYRTIGKLDRRVRWVAAKGRGIFDAGGRCTRVIGTAIEITARKADEVRLRELNEELEKRVAAALAEKKILADIVEGTDAFVQVADLQYRWLAINKAAADEWARIYGPRPTVGANMLELLHDQPQHRADVAALWGRALAGEGFTVVAEFGDAARDRRHYEIRFNSLHDKDGRRVGAYHFVYDVTERVRGQERLVLAEEGLRQVQKMEAVGQLTGGIAHDFNNILQAVQGSLQLIQRVPADPRVRTWADNALLSIRRGADVTSRLLTFARQQQVEPKSVVAADVVTGMADMLKHSIGPLVDLKFDLASAGATVTVDTTQLEMAVLNLAINARDAMPRGGTLTVATRVLPREGSPLLASGDYVALEITDTGTGMPLDVVARAFDPFFTTKDVGKGTGLGLSQVYGMAKQAGGAAFVQSEVGRGTTVSLMLPLAKMRPTESGASPSHEKAVRAARSRILVVDDDSEVRATVVASLEVLGHEVRAAANGGSALLELDTFRPDLLIVDFAMPEMNGAELADRVRARLPHVPIIFASGYRDVVATEKVGGAATAILRKPFEMKNLEMALKQLLGNKG